MELTQKQQNIILKKIDKHFKDIGICNQYKLKDIINTKNNGRTSTFIFEIFTPTFSTDIYVDVDIEKEFNSNEQKSTISWMDYKKITE